MKIIYLTDIHGAFDRIKELLNITIADLYIIGGDLINIPFYNMESAIKLDELHKEFSALRKNAGKANMILEDFVEDLLNSPDLPDDTLKKADKLQHLTVRARRVMQQKYKIIENIISIKKTSNILCIPGNYDMDLKYTSLHERDLHLHRFKFNGAIIAGYGGADIWTPGIPEKYIVKYNAGKNIDKRKNEMINYFKAVKPDIIVTHMPAYGIHDKLKSWGPSGSSALRDYCDNNNVLLCLTGHIHNDWGFKENENTIFLNPSSFGEITAVTGDVLEGGSFYTIEIEESSVKSVLLQKYTDKRIYDIAEYKPGKDKWTENIIDRKRLDALKKNENYDTTTEKYSHVPEINLYNDIKDFFRTFQTRETEARVEKLEKITRLIEDKVEGIAMDVAGSVNMGLSQPSSDIDIVLYIQCSTPCRTDWTECSHLKNAKDSIEKSLDGQFKFEIIDCLDLNQVEKDIRDKNYESDSAQRFVAYRSMFRPINYKFIAPIEDLLNEDIDFKKELEGSIRSYLKILANTSKHINSFKKYKARINSLGITIPRSIEKKIEDYLQVREVR